MCPYARFQSAMFDRDTLIVTYDKQRGDPRGSRRVNDGEKPQGLGDCIDCQLCVQVCPTGIDIRNGLQYECINCALCVDACNSVMKKVGYAPNLISYSTENRMEGKPTHILRFRTIGYGTVMFVMCALLVGALVFRETTDLKVLRERNSLYQVKDGQIENVYTIKLGNRDNKAHNYTLTVDLPDSIIIDGQTSVTVDSGEVQTIPVRVAMPTDKWPGHNLDMNFSICLVDDSTHCVHHESRFTGPVR
jgi:cytochrome c oxidase accessory protein FixG